MTYRRMLWIAIVVGLLSAAPGVALALDEDFTVPEPGTLTLLASGVAALGGIGWLRRRKK